jgi:hypothetical protein
MSYKCAKTPSAATGSVAVLGKIETIIVYSKLA